MISIHINYFHLFPLLIRNESDVSETLLLIKSRFLNLKHGFVNFITGFVSLSPAMQGLLVVIYSFYVCTRPPSPQLIVP